MKKTMIKAMLLVLLCSQATAQTEQLNHEKYWNFRDNLKRKYLMIGNYNASGVQDLGRSIPIENIDAGNQNCTVAGRRMRWGDATLHQGYYIASLATEYELLRRAGKDYSSTLNELYYAISAINRLDDYGEDFLNFPNLTSINRNGFLVRDDVPDNFINHFSASPDNVTCISSERYYTDGGSASNNFFNQENEMSQDQIIGLFFGFAFVKKYLDPNLIVKPTPQDLPLNLVTEVGNITDRIMGHVTQQWTESKSYSAPGCGNPSVLFERNWMIKNPVTGTLVNRGANMWAFAPFVADLAHQINGQVYNTNISSGISYPGLWPQCQYGSPTHPSISVTLASIKSLWNTQQNNNWQDFTITFQNVPDFHMATLYLSSNDITYDFMEESNRQMTLSLLSTTNSWSKANIGRLAWDADMSIFDLVRSTLHGGGTVAPQAAFFNLLNLAPCEGPHSATSNNPAQWRSSSMWWKPTGSAVSGEFNGIDYMLLYNLYMLEFGNTIPGVTFQNASCPCAAVPKKIDASINQSHQLLQSVTLDRKFPEYLAFNNSVPEFLTQNLTLMSPYNLNAKTELVVCNNSVLKAWSPNSLILGSPSGIPEESGVLRVRSGSQFILESNGQAILYPNSKIIIESGATFIMRDNSKLIVNDHAHVVVEAGATFVWNNGTQFVMQGSQSMVDIYAATGIQVQAGEVFRVNKGIASLGGTVNFHYATFSLESNSQLKLEHAALVCSDLSTVTYHANADIQLLGDQAMFGLQCNTYLDDNANFTFQYPGAVSGYIQLGTMTMTAGINCQFNLTGQGKGDLILQLAGGAVLPDNLTALNITDGKIDGMGIPGTPGGGSMSTGSGPLHITNCKGTNYGVLSFYGQRVYINGCDFDNNNIALSDFLVGVNHHNPMIVNCTFNHCNTSVLNYGVGAFISNSSFTNNLQEAYQGWALNYNTYIGNCSFTDNSTTGTGTHIDYSAAAPASFSLKNSTLLNTPQNGDVGIDGSGGQLLARCNVISGNKYNSASSCSIWMSDNGFINMNNDLGGGFNDLSGNATLAHLVNAYAELNNGGNNLSISQPNKCMSHGINCKPFISGSSSGLNCNGSLHVLNADHNFWNIPAAALGLNTFDLEVAPMYSCNDEVIYNDNQPNASGQTCPLVPVVFSGPNTNPLINGIHVSSINTQRFPNTPLHTAVNTSVATMDTSVANGYKQATHDLVEILNYQIPAPTAEDEYIRSWAYRKLMEAVSQANYYGQLPDSLVPEYAEVLNLQQSIINKAIAQADYEKRYYTSFDKAAVYRLAGSIINSVAMVTDVLAWNNSADLPYTNQWLCYYTAEQLLKSGQMNREGFAEATKLCQEQALPRHSHQDLTASTNEKATLVSIMPNPNSGNFIIKLNQKGVQSIEVFQSNGQRIRALYPSEEKELNLDLTKLGKGIYLIKAITSSGTLQTEKVVVE